jgi:hypothetical protein
MLGRSLEGNAAASARGNAAENLIQRGLISISDQTAAKVLLQGLMRAGSPFA